MLWKAGKPKEKQAPLLSILTTQSTDSQGSRGYYVDANISFFPSCFPLFPGSLNEAEVMVTVAPIHHKATMETACAWLWSVNGHRITESSPNPLLKEKKKRKYVTFSAQWFPRAICVTGWEEAKSIWVENTLGGRLASLHCRSGSLCDPWLSLFYHVVLFFFSASFFFFFSASRPPPLNGEPVHPSESCFTPIPQWDPYLFPPLQKPRDPEKKRRRGWGGAVWERETDEKRRTGTQMPSSPLFSDKTVSLEPRRLREGSRRHTSPTSHASERSKQPLPSPGR